MLHRVFRFLFGRISFAGRVLVGWMLVFAGCGADTDCLVLIHGLLIDGTGADPVPDAVVVIRQGRIESVGAAGQVKIPVPAQCYDLGGAAVLPGFINAHVHRVYEAERLRSWAQGGVTTVRDLGSQDRDGKWFERRDSLHSDPLCARLVAAGPFLTVPNGYPIQPWNGWGITITSPDEAADAAGRLLDQGADLIKTTLETGAGFGLSIPAPTVEEVRAMVRVAHAQGTRVSAHILQSNDLEELLAAGVDDIAHMVSDDLSAEMAARVVDRGVYWVPTLELWYVVDQAYGGSRLHQNAIRNLRRFIEAGGAPLVALGTDYAGYSGTFDLGMPMREVQFMQEAGMTPMQIIRSATEKAAVVCNRGGDLGTLEAGKVADLLVVAENPLQDLQALTRPVLVVHRGVVVRSSLVPQPARMLYLPAARREVRGDAEAWRSRK